MKSWACGTNAETFVYLNTVQQAEGPHFYAYLRDNTYWRDAFNLYALLKTAFMDSVRDITYLLYVHLA